MDKQAMVHFLAPQILTIFSDSPLLWLHQVVNSVHAHPVYSSWSSLSGPLYFIKATLIATFNESARITLNPHSHLHNIFHGHGCQFFLPDTADTDHLPASQVSARDNTAASYLSIEPHICSMILASGKEIPLYIPNQIKLRLSFLKYIYIYLC